MNKSVFILGVDLDGVVGDFYGAMREVAALWLNRPVNELTENVSFGLDEWDINNFGGYERLHRYAVTQCNLFSNMRPIKDAPSILRKLSGRGIRIRIITNRLFLKYFHRATITQTVDWLDKHDIPYWDICFMNDKGAVGAHVYIDDAPRNIINLRKNGCRTIVFSNSTNRDMPAPKADNWHEVESLVMESLDEWQTGTLGLFGAEGFRAVSA
ncbi:MAG: 5'-nucleotidase [Spirochaetaceae bacterium]|jgi:5'(3')-deoxyribonucleotidase|nr:5'-nucleotidase [Spirochaetaceae bacterium]